MNEWMILLPCEQKPAESQLKPGFHYPSWRPELMGDQFPLPVNTGRVDGRAFPLAELTGRQLNSASGNWALVTALEVCVVSIDQHVLMIDQVLKLCWRGVRQLSFSL